jgi:hypothetical protein
MPVQINEPVTLSATKTYKPIETLIKHWPVGEAFVTYGLFSDEGNMLRTDQRHYTGEAFNIWFENFNSGSFLDAEWLVHLGVEVELPENNEDYYYNSTEQA